MKSKLIILPIIFIFMFIVNLYYVSGMLEYWQDKTDMGNGTIQNHLVAFYTKNAVQISTTPENSFLCTWFHIFCVSNTGVIEDYVSGNNPYEVYLLYNIYVKKWNTNNPNYKVSSCDWIVKFWGHLENSTTIVVNQTYTEADPDVMFVKYFMQLNDGDGLIADQICHFRNPDFTDLDLPADMQLVTPSWECKACQSYEWSLVERDVLKAKAIGDNVVTISEYIKKLFLLNFEIWLALFWFLLILLIFISIGFIFIIAWWLYLYMKSVVK